MAQIIGDSGVVYFGPRDQPQSVRWWAERGILHWEDARDNGYGSVGIKEFLYRLQAINDMIANGKRKENEGFMHVDEIGRHQRFIEEALGLVQRAKEQGDPGDPDVRKHKAQNRPVTMVMPSSVSMAQF